MTPIPGDGITLSMREVYMLAASMAKYDKLGWEDIWVKLRRRGLTESMAKEIVFGRKGKAT